MLFTYTGGNTHFLEQSLFDVDGALSVEIASATASTIVLAHTVYVDANVTVTLRGTGFLVSDTGAFLSGQITQIEFDGLGVRQGTLSGLNWSAPDFQTALYDISDAFDFQALATLFNRAGPITIDATGGLNRYDQEFAWEPFLPLLTQPITFLGSPFGDSIQGTAGRDVIEPNGNSDARDRIVGTEGSDRIVFDQPAGTQNSGYWLDYDTFTDGLTFNVNGEINAASILGPGFVDRLENVIDALGTSLGLEGSTGADTYNIRTTEDQVLLLNGNQGSDAYNINAGGGVVVLDFLFGTDSPATSGLDLDLATGVIANDGFGFAETLAIQNAPEALVVLATDNADIVRDGPGDHLIRLFEGDDTFFAGIDGIDSVDGGEGLDTIVFDQMVQGSTTIGFLGGQSIINDRNTPESSTSVFGVEHLQTQGGVILELDKHDGIGLIAAADLVALTELYIAYFNRAADALGLSFWATAFEKNGFSLRDIADLFFDQPETTALYSDVSDGDFVQAVYNNVLGRDADQAGFDFWTGQLSSGNVSESGFILELLAGARAVTGSPADVAFIEDKTDIGLYFGAIQGQNNLTAAKDVMSAFNGSQVSLAIAQALSDDALTDAINGDLDLLMPVLGVVDNPFPDIA